MKPFVTAVFLGFFVLSGLALAQTQPADRTLGEVTSVDTEHRGLVLKEDKGGSVTVSIGEKTSLLRIPPGETDLKKAARITFADIGTGDRLLAAGARTGDKMEARTVVVMSKADIAQKQQQDEEEWQKRGIAGTVASLESSDKSFVVTVGAKKYKVTATEKTEYRRYAADSAKYSDSKESSLPDMKTGDQVRVLGDKDDAALTLTAERVVFGTFSRVAGTISSINAETGEIKLNDLLNKKSVMVQITPRSNARRLPPAVASLIAQRLIPAGQNGPVPASAGRGGAARTQAVQGPDLSQMLDRLPTISLADLKPGAAIILAGSPQGDASHITAITIIAGIEPIMTAGASFVQDLIGGWNLGGGGGGDLGESVQ
jgi:hypothetical protein